MANFNIFSSLVDYQNQLGTVPTNTQDFERFSPGFNLDGVDFLPGIFVTSNLPKVEAFKGSGDTELFILDRQSVREDSFYKINFDQPYNAVGFDIDSFNPSTPGPAILDIFFADGDTESIEIFPTNATESDPIFFGVIADTEIDNIILTEGPEINGVGNEEIALDNFIVPQQIGQPDLQVTISIPDSTTPGSELSPIEVTVKNTGDATAFGTDSAGSEGYMVDLILSSDTEVPDDFAIFSPNYNEDVLLEGGRISNTPDLAAGEEWVITDSGGIPTDTPEGDYYLTAQVDPGKKITESDESNNVTLEPLKIEDSGSNQRRTFVPNQIIIKVKDGENSEDSKSLQAELGAQVSGTTQTLGIQLWTIPNISVEEVIETYRDDPRIEFIDLNYNDATLGLTPNDPDFSNLWGLHNTGQTGGTIDADIDAPEAWGFVPPEPGVIPTGGDAVVGVVDTGVDYTHPDLDDNIWINTGEIPGNGIDDDSNGYIDDVRGWDFFNNDNDPMDGHSHGTHVAGTIGAEGDNAVGVVGVNWDVEIMPLKIFSDAGAYAGDFAAIQAIDYATLMGADLTNHSWGTAPLPPGTLPNPAMVNAINNGPLLVAIAHNHSNDNDVNPVYPASINLDNIISVAATDHNDDIAGFSNYGATSVDLGAPGVSIYSTTPGNSYGFKNGTSMAAPHVSGAAALMIATRRDRGLPDLTTLDLRQKVLNAIDLIPALSGNTATEGRLNLYGGINQQGIGWGDVHFVTFDNRKYDLQSFGDFILAETARKDDDWVVQTRQEPWVSNNSVSVNTAFATLVDGQRVVFDLDFDNRLQIDGVDVTLADGETLSVGNSQIERSADEYMITYAGDDGIVDSADAKLTARDRGNHINITISHFGRMQGLLGNNDGNSDNDFALRNGTQLPSNLTVEEIHGKYADSWRVPQGESLFDNSDVVIGPPETFISLDDFDPDEVRDAREKALLAGIPDGEILDAVTLDLLVTEDDNFLEGAVELFGVETDGAPDLIVNSFEVTGDAFISDDNLKLPIEVVVKNQGDATAEDLFKVDVQYTQEGEAPFVVAFTADETSEVNPDNPWYPFTKNPLDAGDEVTFTGELTFVDDSLVGQPISLVATADSIAGEEFVPESGRVEESNEDNNTSEITELILDVTDDDAAPDLIVNSFEITGDAFISDDNLKLPIEVVVKNQGDATAEDLFKVDVQYTQEGEAPFVVAFTADETSEVNPDNPWYPFTKNPLDAGDEVTFTGELTFIDDSLLGEEISLVATADSKSGDEFIPDFGRVEESNEDNNSSEIVEVTLDDDVETQEIISNFEIEGPNSVPYQLFNVLVPGPIEVEVDWEGEGEDLTVSLEGRRAFAKGDPSPQPSVQVTDSSPLKLTYNVTEEDIARGVGWRLVIRGEDGTNIQGDVKITTPFDSEVNAAFQQQKISLRSGDLLPTSALEGDFFEELTEDQSSEGLHGIITLYRTPEHDELLKLEKAGIDRQSFLPNKHAYGLVEEDFDLSDPNLPPRLVRSITPLTPEDKIVPDILVGNYQEYFIPEIEENYVLSDNGTLQLSVLFARDVSVETIQSILQQEAISFAPITDNLWEVEIEAESLINLATYDQVEWIDPGTVPDLPENDNTRPVVNVDDVQDPQADGMGNLILSGGFPVYDGLSGNGINVGVDDSGIDATHPDLNVVADIVASGSHGTHVAGIIAANGVQSNSNGGTPFQWRGMAPDAGLIDSGNLINAANVLDAINDDSLDISNHSHALSPDGNYNGSNQTVDQLIRGGATSGGEIVPKRPKVFSAGNGGGNAQYGNQLGYFAITKQVKNAVVVGNWNASDGDGDINNDSLSTGSSLGPAYDGRIKPDVVAPGSSIRSTNTSDGYTFSSGTSMASPVVAGIEALMLEGWQNTYSTPLGTTVDDRPPLPSTLRALLIQTAVDIVDDDVRNSTLIEIDSDSNQVNGNDGLGRATATIGPDFATGWGLVDAEAAVEVMQDFRLEGGVPIPNRIIQDAVMHNGIIEYDFVVDQDFINSGNPLKVTLGWDDFEAAIQNPAINPMLVNDLDLELIAPDGTIFYPWQLGHTIEDGMGNPLPNDAQPPGTVISINQAITGTLTPDMNNDYIPANALTGNGAWVATRGKDHLNNVEQVLVDSDDLEEGHWQARVIGFDVQAGIAQDYSLVGFPYPDLPELVTFSDDKVTLPSGGGTVEFDWTVSNIGTLPTAIDFEYEVLLSTDFFADAGDVVLTDTNQASLGPLNVGASVNHTSEVTINDSHAQDLLGNPAATIDDLIDQDAFLLVRADSDDEILEHNEENTTFIQLGRIADVVLVMDRSGSMASEVAVSSGFRPKIELLQDSANLFLDLIRLDAGDRLGEVSFAGSVSTDFGPGEVLTAITSGNIDDAKDEVDDLNAFGSTNIEGALQEGLDLLTTAPGGEDHRRVIVFLSDGMPTAGGDPTDPVFLQQFDDEDVKVFSVGFGTEGASGNAGIDVDLLETLTNVGEGFYHVTESALELDKFFVNAVAGAIGSDVIVDPIDDIDPGETHTIDITLGQQDSVASFILTSDNPEFPLDLSLRSPSGLEINANNFNLFGGKIAYIDAPTHDIFQVHLPIAAQANIDHAETWEMVISNPNDATVTYSASAIAESTIHLDFLPPISSDGIFNPGEAIPLQVILEENNQLPILDASVSVSVIAPTANLSDLLSSGIVTEEDLAKVPVEIEGERLGLRERMVIALQNKLGENPLSTVELDPIELTESDNGGFYSGRFGDTKIPGTYTFVINVEGFTSDWQPFQRETTYTVNVSDEIDPNQTDINVTIPQRDTGVVTITPKTTSGNFVGPGFADDIKLEAKGLNPTTPVIDNLDGSYTQEFELEANIEEIELSIQVLDTVVNVDNDIEPPADEPPVDEPPADEPPADEPPVDEPPADEPPVDEPPTDEPPADEPPTDEPPTDEPPADEPENQTIIGDSGSNILNGGEGNDQLNGRRGDDKLRGNSGDDNLNGGLGQDTVVGGSGNDIVNGGRGNDKLLGTSGNDILLGRPGNDILLGGTGDDILEGGIGRDRLNGGPGNDKLTGGGSIDRFIFNTNKAFQTEDLGIDEITDFSQTQGDIILLNRTTFTAINSESGTGFSIADEFAVVTDDEAAKTYDAFIVYNSNNGNLFYNPNGSAPGFDNGGQFATLTNTPLLEAEDFFIRN
ncbi:S8 family serine peptidase [Dapis sp. BLCC M126]|uniref:S8 family serine peptidase n=1 Tax=Dapis sp. BLCC M126 TaxID=3400189 RepID=UPI003CF42AEE